MDRDEIDKLNAEGVRLGDVIEVSPGHFVIRRYWEDPEYRARSERQSQLIDEARAHPKARTREEQAALDQVVNHMIYG